MNDLELSRVLQNEINNAKAEKLKEWRKANPEKVKAQKKRQEANRKLRMATDEEYRTKHQAYDRANKRKHYEQNREKYLARSKEWRTNNKEQRRNSYFVKTYDINLDDYNRMFEDQAGCCAICGTHQLDLSKNLFVDHCHNTGEVRGLLCHHCNTMLGLSFDNIDTLLNAIEYLRRH